MCLFYVVIRMTENWVYMSVCVQSPKTTSKVLQQRCLYVIVGMVGTLK